jgi:tRNA threonylcarbamoyladenosine biosynthesis protein TsaB
VNLLGFDTSTAATSACVLRADGRSFELAPDPDRLAGRPAHARELMPAVRSVMEDAGLAYQELDAIAVGVGPGSFTGLRIGVSTARALGMAHGLELRPVSSLAALAEGIDAPVRLPLIDARRGELFGALYREAQPRERQWEPFAATPEALAERVRAEGATPRAAGDGSIRFRDVLEAAGITVEPDSSGAHVVRALHLCRLADEAPGAAAEAVLPEYLRPPDAAPRT